MDNLPTVRDALVPAEIERLETLEFQIGTGMATFKTVGLALEQIRDSRLYRQAHRTFEEYCRVRWNLRKATAYQYIEGAKVVRLLETSAIADVPQTESQARPLTRLLPEAQPAAWQAALAKAAAYDRPVTAKDVTKAVQAIMREANHEQKEEPQKDQNTKQEEPKEAREPGLAMEHAAEAINALRKIRKNDPARDNAMRTVAKWIHDNG